MTDLCKTTLPIGSDRLRKSIYILIPLNYVRSVFECYVTNSLKIQVIILSIKTSEGVLQEPFTTPKVSAKCGLFVGKGSQNIGANQYFW